MGYKSRGNYSLGSNLSQERWNKIFGKYKDCPKCEGLGYDPMRDVKLTSPEKSICLNCKGTGKIKNDKRNY